MTPLKSLYITYDGINDPLGKSQILPYLKRLGKNGIEIFLLSFEKDKDNSALKTEDLKKELNAFNIHWIPVKFHKGPFIAKLWDIMLGIWHAAILICKNKIKIVHARGHFPAFIPLCLKIIFPIRFIFDMRGLWVEEKIDAGVLPKEGFKYRLAKWLEKRILISADEIVVLTEVLKDKMNRLPYLEKKTESITVIPTCVDLKLFYPANGLKKNDVLFKDKFVVSYFGSIGTYYNFPAMIDFYKTLASKVKNAYLLIMSNASPDIVKKIIEDNGVGPEKYYLDSVEYEEVPRWARASDVSLIFYNRTYSKEGCCPTKFAEYLASGVPVVINSGIGDVDKIVEKYRLGVVINEFNEESYSFAVEKLLKLIEEKKPLSERCHKAAKDLFSLDIGAAKYSHIYNRACCN